MEEQVLYTQPYPTEDGLEPAALATIENYLNRHLGIQIRRFYYSPAMTFDDVLITDSRPIRHVIAEDKDEEMITVNHYQNKIYPPSRGWRRPDYTITYAAGYGALTGNLASNVDSSFSTALEDDYPLPGNLSLALRLLTETFEDRDGRRFDVQGTSQELGSTQYISAVYKSTIPSEIKGLLLSERKMTIG